MEVLRLGPGDTARARAMFSMMAAVFEEECGALSDDYVGRLLARPEFWAIAAIENDVVVGGVTAHALAMTRKESTELFIYDLAVDPDHQRKGIGRTLVTELRARASDAGIDVSFVPADDEDDHAIEFYRALGAEESPVTFFTFSRPG